MVTKEEKSCSGKVCFCLAANSFFGLRGAGGVDAVHLKRALLARRPVGADGGEYVDMVGRVRGCELKISQFGVGCLSPGIRGVHHHVVEVTWVSVLDGVDLFAVDFDVVDVLALHEGLSDLQLRPAVHGEDVVVVVGVADLVVDVAGDVEGQLARVEADKRHAVAGASVVVSGGGEVDEVGPGVGILPGGFDVDLHVPDSVQVGENGDKVARGGLEDAVDDGDRCGSCNV